MKSSIKLQKVIPSLLIFLALSFLVLSQTAQAVGPEAPDMALAGGNTADGNLALGGLTSGVYNSAFGIYSLLSNGAANFNTGVGAGALLSNTEDQNTAVGAGALLTNTTGFGNTANGAFALFSNTIGQNNTAIGTSTLFSNVDGSNNNAVGLNALGSHMTGDFNNAVGSQSLSNDTNGESNNAFGDNALAQNVSGSFNTAIGDVALASNNADSNTAVGSSALALNTTGGGNTAVGDFSLSSNTTGSFNEAMGVNALASNDSGFYNIAVGDDTLSNNVSGSHNIIVGGFGAGFNIVAGSNNIYIGPGVSANGPFDESDTIRIRDSAPAAGGATSQVFFAGIDGSTVGAVNAPVLVNPNGQLGTGVSSARFKKDIDPMGTTSEAIFSLKPVTFHYKGDTTNTAQFGLIAEEVAKVNRALILVDNGGKPYSVRYEHINAMLLNEFLKEHRTVQELKSTVRRQEGIIAQQQKTFESKLAVQERQIGILTAGLEKVSAQLAAGGPPRGGLTGSEASRKIVLSNR